MVIPLAGDVASSGRFANTAYPIISWKTGGTTVFGLGALLVFGTSDITSRRNPALAGHTLAAAVFVTNAIFAA